MIDGVTPEHRGAGQGDGQPVEMLSGTEKQRSIVNKSVSRV